MMKFDEFKGYVQMAIQNKMPHVNIDCKMVHKANLSYTALTLHNESSAAVNLDEMYYRYRNGTDVDTIVDAIADVLNAPIPDGLNADMFADYDTVKAKLYMRLINADANSDILKESPFMVQEDLALVPTIFISDNATSMVTTSMLDTWGVDAVTVCKDAMENSQKIMPVNISPMSGIIFGCGNDDMLVVMSAKGIHGASALFYDGVLAKIADKFGGKFFALPSSIHEWICVPTDNLDVAELEDMVRTINRTVVDKADWLSDNVYRYDDGFGFRLAKNA